MDSSFVEKNVLLLRKLRMLNIEINNTLSSDLSGIRQLYIMKKEKLLEEKEGIVLKSENVKKAIEAENRKIYEFNNLIKTNDSISEDDLEVLKLKIMLSEKKISGYEKDLIEYDKDIEGINNSILKLSNLFNVDDSDKFAENNENAVVVDLYKSVNYIKEMLNSGVLCKYNQIAENFEKNMYKYPVAAIVNGFCENCNIAVPLQSEIDVLKLKDYIMCEICGCFLVDVIKS